MLHACIQDLLVEKIIDVVDEDHYRELSKTYPAVISIEGLVPTPYIGWRLEGVNIVPPSENWTVQELDEQRQRTRRQFGVKLLPIAIDKLGARNMQIVRGGGAVDTAGLATQLTPLKTLLETGSLPTCVQLLAYSKTVLPVYADIFDWCSIELLVFLQDNP